jgi:hypothetical protein
MAVPVEVPAGGAHGEGERRRHGEPMWFGADPDDSYAFVLGLMGWMLEGLDQGERHEAVGRLRDRISQHSTAGAVTFASATWLITAIRH